MNTAKPCLLCKGSRALCGQRKCPLIPRFRIAPEIKKKVGTDFFGPNYNLFIGRMGLPNVYMGPLVAVEHQQNLDKPDAWYGMGYDQIIRLRSLLIRSKQRENIHAKSSFVEKLQELALASKPTDVELAFKKRPVLNVSFSDITQPMGPTATMERLRIAENTKISQKVEYIARDEIKAAEASHLLYKLGLDIHKIMTIFSSGILGLQRNQKIVPTRFSVTALDDILAKHMMDRIRGYKQVDRYMVFEAQYLDNHFVILLMPGGWEFENFEAWAPGAMWAQNLKKPQIIEEYEPYKGRTTYASLQSGGYYSSRFSVCRYLDGIKRQARVIAFREIYEGYLVPVGVWLVREVAKHALESSPVVFGDLKSALAYIDTRLRLPVSEYSKQSRILSQMRLTDFSAW